MRNRLILDIQKLAPAFAPTVIFDVGAHNGRSVLEFASAFPQASIHAFEPVQSVYEQLVEGVSAHANVNCHRAALGDADKTGLITNRRSSKGNRIVQVADGTPGTEPVQITTGDSFCRDAGVETVHLLHVDAEGSELAILVGFTNLIRADRIAFIQITCGLTPENTSNAPFDRVYDLLTPFGYRFFGIYSANRNTRPGQRGLGIYSADIAFVQRSGLPATLGNGEEALGGSNQA